MQRRELNNSGFTLIELMIVIAIIAVLAGIMIPNFARSRAQSKLTGCCENLKNIATALEMYANDNNGVYPLSGSAGIQELVPHYLPSIPVCPASGLKYKYVTGGKGTWQAQHYVLNCGGGNAHKSLGIADTYPRYGNCTCSNRKLGLYYK